jgi:formate dehydrogenase major subunit
MGAEPPLTLTLSPRRGERETGALADIVHFTLDGAAVTAAPGETIWQVAKRLGTTIPHLCHHDGPGYRPDGNCRACMVEIAGERVLAASCRRTPTEGMAVTTDSARATASRAMVFEMLAADMPAREASPDPDAPFWQQASALGVGQGRLPVSPRDSGLVLHDASHAAIAVNLDACIACGLCERACREVQVNDVIGMAFRGHDARPVFDLGDPMGRSTCVGCGECVQVCPTGALIEKTLLAPDARTCAVIPDREVDTLCPYCGVGCQTRVAVKDARIVRVDGRDGPANENRLCIKGRFGYDYIAHPHRLTVPLIRRDDAPKSGDIVVDPANPFTHFRETSWDEALTRAARGFLDIRVQHGSAALAGFGSAKGSNEEAYLFQKLIRTGFGTNNVDHCTRLCHASSVAALIEDIGSGAVTAPFTAAADADCIVVIGARPTENHPVAASYLKQAVKRGAKLIVIDPRGHDLMRHATHPVRFTAGTDVALLNAMLHVIVTENLTDHAYIAAHVDGYEALVDRVRGTPPEMAEAVCGVAADTIRQIARLYATSRASIIFWGMGISQHVHGTDNARALIALALITGQIGRPGTGLHPLRGQNNVQGASDAGLIPMVYPDYRSVEDAGTRARFEDFWGTSLDPTRGLTVVEILHAAEAGRIKGMYILGENPAMSDPDQRHARLALARLDHLVVQDIFLTETAWHADVVLPASAHAEKSGTFTNTNRQVQLAWPVLSPPGQARPDWEIVVSLANRMGLGWHYRSVADVYEELRQVMPPFAGVPWSRLEADGAAMTPATTPDDPGKAILFGDRFPTPSGRARVVPVDALPPDEEPDAEYPFLLNTGRLLEHWHTGAMTRRANVLDAIEHDAVVALHPGDAARLGIEAGEDVRITTRRGSVHAHVRLDRDVAIGSVFIPFAFAEAAANLLTNPALDPYGKIPEFKICAAKVEKAG